VALTPGSRSISRNPVSRWTLRIVAAVAAIAVLWLAWIAAHIGWYRYNPPRETAFMTQRMNEARTKTPKAQLQYEWVSYAKISPQLKRAMIAAEDAKFVSHDGFDWDGIQQALEKNRKKGHVVAGGSTITQQLAKNLFLSPSKSYWRKAEEAIVSVLLEAILPKTRIFELYLNVIEWGSGIFGAEAAAKHYFGVTAAQLSAEQAARLAAMAPAPRRFERNPDSGYLAGRVATILARMPSAQVP
jgi:monofunctional biosynthetic peptidoglycan transglycosylase